jgi:hypothetical protein
MMRARALDCITREPLDEECLDTRSRLPPLLRSHSLSLAPALQSFALCLTHSFLSFRYARAFRRILHTAAPYIELFLIAPGPRAAVVLLSLATLDLRVSDGPYACEDKGVTPYIARQSQSPS